MSAGEVWLPGFYLLGDFLVGTFEWIRLLYFRIFQDLPDCLF